ncbi:MAG: GNAT family N-acetyltransferase [Paludibacteraceae bacterium]|nr:GNAT family N-acetyltransferase [Paludibacteraceae bacterium]
MEAIIPPVDRALLKAELTPDKFLRDTNKAGNQIYVTTAAASPVIMREIARLRETAFRLAGGGGGNSLDMDQYDTMDVPYKQLFVWDPDAEEILGGYRFICGPDIRLDAQGQPVLSTAEMYRFSDRFITEYLPYTIELGRSFVHPDYQSSKMGAKSLFALDNLWDGLGAMTVLMPDMKYCFGKVTIYPQYNSVARELIFGFLRKFFPDPEELVTPHTPFPVRMTPAEADVLFPDPDLRTSYRQLNRMVRELGVNIPPLVNAYMGLSPNMRTFGFAEYEDFGHLIEFAISIPLDDIYEEKKKRHIESFMRRDRVGRFILNISKRLIKR